MNAYEKYWLEFKASSLKDFKDADLAIAKDIFYSGATAFIVLLNDSTVEGEITKARKELSDYLIARMKQTSKAQPK